MLFRSCQAETEKAGGEQILAEVEPALFFNRIFKIIIPQRLSNVFCTRHRDEDFRNSGVGPNTEYPVLKCTLAVDCLVGSDQGVIIPAGNKGLELEDEGAGGQQ